MSFVTLLIGLAMLTTVAVLISGLVSMEHGGAFDERASGRLMFARVGAQGLVVALLLLALFLEQH